MPTSLSGKFFQILLSLNEAKIATYHLISLLDLIIEYYHHNMMNKNVLIVYLAEFVIMDLETFDWTCLDYRNIGGDLKN